MRLRLALLIFLLLCSSILYGQEQGRPSGETLFDLFTRGYEALRRSPSEGLPWFEKLVRLDSNNVTALRQLGSIYSSLGRTRDALGSFSRANKIHPSDTTELDIAYLLSGMGEYRESHRAFSSLRGSEDPTIRERAEASLLVLNDLLCGEHYPEWGRVYADPFYDGRFGNVIFNAWASAGEYLGSSRIVSLYLTAAITRDTRSVGGALPVIYSDNYGLFGAGLRLQPLKGLTAEIQGSVTADLIKRPDHARTQADFRAVATYGNGWYPDIELPQSIQTFHGLFADAYASFGYYSRYENSIGYGQARAGVRVLAYRSLAVDAYVRGNLTADSRNEFYNNIAEGGFGLRCIPDHSWGLTVLFELYQGTYWRSTTTPIPYDRSYTSFRIFVVLDKCFTW